MPRDLQRLPKLRDSLSFLYIERAIIEQDNLSIRAIRADGTVPIPIAAMTVLMLGPGISITHAAIKAICDNGCTVIWCGETASRFYAVGMGETRSAENLLHQAKLCMDEALHMQVVRRMYERRFSDMDCSNLSLSQIRGMEGVRVREAYRLFSNSMVFPGPSVITKPLPGKMPILSIVPSLPQTACCMVSARALSFPWAIPPAWALSTPERCYPLYTILPICTKSNAASLPPSLWSETVIPIWTARCAESAENASGIKELCSGFPRILHGFFRVTNWWNRKTPSRLANSGRRTEKNHGRHQPGR